MPDATDITFNIVFVRRTVRFLCSFVHSLVDRTTKLRFRLVSNGCSHTEARILQDLCSHDERLSFLDLSYQSTRPHGIVLNALHQRERSPFFAFMDSDCFATSDFSEPLAFQLQRADAVFSGRPIWSEHLPHRLGKGFRLLHCPYDELHDGQYIGNSYFAVYNHEIVSQCMQETNISFPDYHWQRIPRPIQQELECAGKKLEWYDTGKLLNILLGLRGYRCKYAVLPSLWHIGGISFLARNRLRRRLVDALEAFRLERPLRRILKATPWHDDKVQAIGAEERKQLAVTTERKRRVSDHFFALLRSFEKRSPPVRPFRHDDERLVACVASADTHIRSIHADWLASMSPLLPVFDHRRGRIRP